MQSNRKYNILLSSVRLLIYTALVDLAGENWIYALSIHYVKNYCFYVFYLTENGHSLIKRNPIYFNNLGFNTTLFPFQHNIWTINTLVWMSLFLFTLNFKLTIMWKYKVQIPCSYSLDCMALDRSETKSSFAVIECNKNHDGIFTPGFIGFCFYIIIVLPATGHPVIDNPMITQ